MKNLYKEKQHVNLYCEKVLREAELRAEKESIDLISDF